MDGRELLAMLRNARRNKFADPMYHSGRKKKEFGSPYLEYLDTLEKAARKMPQPYEFDPGHADGIRHADLDAGERVLNELIYECQRSLEGIANAKIDQEARSWARLHPREKNATAEGFAELAATGSSRPK